MVLAILDAVVVFDRCLGTINVNTRLLRLAARSAPRSSFVASMPPFPASLTARCVCGVDMTPLFQVRLAHCLASR